MSEKTDPELADTFAEEATSAARNRLYAARLHQTQDRRPLASLLTAVAESEEVHTRRILMHMRGKIGDLSAHLDDLIRRKYAAYATAFPKLADRLARQGQQTASEALAQFGEVAKNHFDLLNAASNGKIDATAGFFVCRVCGYIAVDDPPPKCPVCGAVAAKFKAIDTRSRPPE